MGYILFAIGAVIGAIATYALDPKQGAMRRAQLKETFMNSMNNAGNSISDQAEHIGHATNDALHHTEKDADSEIVFEPSGSMENIQQKRNQGGTGTTRR